MDVEHLWQYNEAELARLNQPISTSSSSSSNASSSSSSTASAGSTATGNPQMTNPLLASAGFGNGENTNPDLIAHLCNVADHRLYKIVKWCKSLPLFKHISVGANSIHIKGCFYNVLSLSLRRSTIKSACSSIRGVSCCSSRAAIVRSIRPAKSKCHKARRLAWRRRNQVAYR